MCLTQQDEKAGARVSLCCLRGTVLPAVTCTTFSLHHTVPPMSQESQLRPVRVKNGREPGDLTGGEQLGPLQMLLFGALSGASAEAVVYPSLTYVFPTIGCVISLLTFSSSFVAVLRVRKSKRLGVRVAVALFATFCWTTFWYSGVTRQNEEAVPTSDDFYAIFVRCRNSIRSLTPAYWA